MNVGKNRATSRVICCTDESTASGCLRLVKFGRKVELTQYAKRRGAAHRTNGLTTLKVISEASSQQSETCDIETSNYVISIFTHTVASVAMYNNLG